MKLFDDIKNLTDGESKAGWNGLIAMIILLVIMLSCIYFFIGRPENDGIKAETERLTRVENKILDAVAQQNFDLANLLLPQLRWQYTAETVGGSTITDDQKQIWDAKRKEMGEQIKKIMEGKARNHGSN